MFLAGPWLSIQSLNTHALHQGANMLAAHIETGSIELIAQHASTHELVLQVQYVHATHQHQIITADLFGSIVDAAAAYANQFGLPFDQKYMPAVDYRFALINPTLVSALSRKIVFQRQLPNLGMHGLHIHRGIRLGILAKKLRQHDH